MGKDKGGSGGLVVNVASILGLFCAEQPKGWRFLFCLHNIPFMPPGYQYNVSKSAVVTLTRCIGNEVSKHNSYKILTMSSLHSSFIIPALESRWCASAPAWPRPPSSLAAPRLRSPRWRRTWVASWPRSLWPRPWSSCSRTRRTGRWWRRGTRCLPTTSPTQGWLSLSSSPPPPWLPGARSFVCCFTKMQCYCLQIYSWCTSGEALADGNHCSRHCRLLVSRRSPHRSNLSIYYRRSLKTFNVASWSEMIYLIVSFKDVHFALVPKMVETADWYLGCYRI